jgi:hypothetical protein
MIVSLSIAPACGKKEDKNSNPKPDNPAIVQNAETREPQTETKTPDDQTVSSPNPLDADAAIISQQNYHAMQNDPAMMQMQYSEMPTNEEATNSVQSLPQGAQQAAPPAPIATYSEIKPAKRKWYPSPTGDRARDRAGRPWLAGYAFPRSPSQNHSPENNDAALGWNYDTQQQLYWQYNSTKHYYRVFTPSTGEYTYLKAQF